MGAAQFHPGIHVGMGCRICERLDCPQRAVRFRRRCHSGWTSAATITPSSTVYVPA
ncbi:short-chain fatty acyl-CoA regulator family protein [Streptomyces caniferus]|uniref:short-chain fatty acyl-CoA regulator family protein n=1 Tax=Streptomyces caniferus TaxID=285557 RepID=UPI0033C96561